MREVQSLNDASLIATKLVVSRRLISSNFTHPAKARVDMVVILDGSLTMVKFEQFSKHDSGIVGKSLRERSTVVMDEQAANAERPMDLRVFGVESPEGS